MKASQTFESVKLTVEAIQFTGENSEAVLSFANTAKMYRNGIGIETKEGQMIVSKGDWVLKEPYPTGDRDFYPVKADIFAKRYRPAGQSDNVKYFVWGTIIMGVSIMCFVAGVMFAIWYANH